MSDRTTSPSPLPVLRPTSGRVNVSSLLVGSSECAALPPSPDRGTTVEQFDEDWHRPPSDIRYLQELLNAFEARAAPIPQSSMPSPRVSPGGAACGSALEREKTIEERQIAAQRIREKQVDVIARRRRQARRRCDAVDEAFQKALDRRFQAMQHLAADPPAERLVGQGMTQYVPAALLPDDAVKQGIRNTGTHPLAPRSVVDSLIHNLYVAPATGASMPHSVSALPDKPAGTAREQDAIVFLTQIDPGAAPATTQTVATGANEKLTPSPSQSPPLTSEAASHDAVGVEPPRLTPPATADNAAAATAVDPVDDEGDNGDWRRPTHVTEENKSLWQELGYHVVMVGGDNSKKATCELRTVQQAIQSAGTTLGGAQITNEKTFAGAASASAVAHTTLPCRNTAIARRGPRPSTATFDWMRLAPLPQVCLVQRRLPEEDMSAGALRDWRERHVLAGPAVSTNTAVQRRKPGKQGREWRMGSKSTPQ